MFSNPTLRAFCLGGVLLCPIFAQAQTSNERFFDKSGTVIEIGIPLFAAGYSLFGKDDKTGTQQLAKSLLLTAATTTALKKLLPDDRPDGSEKDGFSSGHTALAFSGAEYVRGRYGWKLGLPAYVAASYVGYSRVRAKRHYWDQVLVGAAIGIGSSYLFVTPYENLTIAPAISADGAGVHIAYQFGQ